MNVVTVPSFKDVSATATSERFIHVRIGDQAFQMHPGTAGELLHQLRNAHDSLLEMPYLDCPRPGFHLQPGYDISPALASN
jgi:hypothetical protein